MIDEVAIWNLAMGAGQIRASMGRPLRGDESGLVALYHADEPSGTTVYDAGSGAMDGQLNNGPVFLPSGAMIPLIPKNPAITPGAANLLTWDRNIETDVVNYRIYRDTSASFITGEWIGTAPDTFFTDPRSAGGVTYYYGITAVDFVTNESDRSVTVSGQSTIGSLSVLPGLTVTFGSVIVGDSAQMPVRVYSSGGSVIVDSARLAIGAVFSRPSGSPLPDTVFAGDTLIGVFQFKPSAFTVFTDTILVFNRSTVNPFRIVLTGTGFGNTNPFAFAVKPVGPAGLTNLPSPVLSWEGRGDPEGQTLSYIVQISGTSDFASIMFADTTNDTTIVIGTALSEGFYFWRVDAEDGYGGSRVSNTGFFRIDLTDPTISLGILRSTVLQSYMDVYVYAGERLTSVTGTLTLGTPTNVTFTALPGQPRLYSAPYKLTQDGTLNISVTGTDSAGNDAVLARDYVVVGIELNKTFILEADGLQIRGTGRGSGYLVARKDEAAFETGSAIIALTAVDMVTDDAVRGMTLSVAYDGSTFDDERKVGLYVEREGQWQYVGGEGSGGMLSVHVSEPAFYRVMYNPDHEILPKQVELAQNYPNPFNPTTTIRFGLPEDSPVRLTVFNILGQKIAELVNDDRTAGYHTVTWDGRNAIGQKVASGIYLYRLETRGLVTTRKMIMLK
jgi:hypothetical protein